MDTGQAIVDAVAAAAAQAHTLVIAGTGTKRDWLPQPGAGDLLAVGEHTGIEDYQPEELVITARAGTPCQTSPGRVGDMVTSSRKVHSRIGFGSG